MVRPLIAPHCIPTGLPPLLTVSLFPAPNHSVWWGKEPIPITVSSIWNNSILPGNHCRSGMALLARHWGHI